MVQSSNASAGWRTGIRRRTPAATSGQQSSSTPSNASVATSGFDQKIASDPFDMRIHEGQLGTALGVSRTPLREALKVLASEGLVELVQGRGAVVKKLTSIDVRDMAGKPPRPPKPSSSSSPGTTVAPGTMGGTAPSANPARSSLDS